MSKKLGEILVGQGIITQPQLEEALQVQLISGGHLGTSLIDLGYVDEQALGEALAQTHRLPYVTAEALQNIPREAIRALSGSLAEKHQAVPIGLEETKLHLAVAAPSTLGTLSSSTGLRIAPSVAHEVRIVEALERYYGIARRPRFVRLGRKLDEQLVRRPREVAASARVPVVVPTPLPQPEPEVGPDESHGYGTDWREVAKQLRLEEDEPRSAEETPPVTERRVPAAATANAGSRRIEDVLDRMCRADVKEELSAAVLDFTDRKMKTSILFVVRSRFARIWDGRGLSLPDGSLRHLKWPVTVGSIFTLLLGNRYYRGAVDGSVAPIRQFYDILRLEIPLEVLLYPIYLNDMLVAILYCDNGPDQPIEAETDDYLKLGEKLPLALNLLLMKMKIRTV